MGKRPLKIVFAPLKIFSFPSNVFFFLAFLAAWLSWIHTTGYRAICSMLFLFVHVCGDLTWMQLSFSSFICTFLCALVAVSWGSLDSNNGIWQAASSVLHSYNDLSYRVWQPYMHAHTHTHMRSDTQMCFHHDGRHRLFFFQNGDLTQPKNVRYKLCQHF